MAYEFKRENKEDWFNHEQKDGEWCLVKCGSADLSRYQIGRWRSGHGWKNQLDQRIMEPLSFIPLNDI